MTQALKDFITESANNDNATKGMTAAEKYDWLRSQIVNKTPWLRGVIGLAVVKNLA